jgi:hypothetical protein
LVCRFFLWPQAVWIAFSGTNFLVKIFEFWNRSPGELRQGHEFFIGEPIDIFIFSIHITGMREREVERERLRERERERETQRETEKREGKTERERQRGWGLTEQVP